MATHELSLFLDTNSLLHYPPIKNVDWKAVCGSESVRLVLCLQVIHELDEKKDDSRLGDRASRTIKELKAIRSAGGVVRDGVILDVFNYEVNVADFPATLSYGSKDDRIVHSIKKYAAANASDSIAVYTEDMGMNLRCEAHGLTVIEPDAGSRLENPKAEHDKKYKLAITELNDLKNRVPVLELVISPGDARTPQKKPMTFSIRPTRSEPDLDSEMNEYMQERNLFPMKKADIASGGQIPSLPHQHDAVARYNDNLSQHLVEYRKWLETRNLLGKILAHQITVSVWIVNSGLAPADDLDVTLEIGDPVALVYEASSQEAKSLELPDPPGPPERPKQFFGDLGEIGGLVRPPLYTLPNMEHLLNRKATVEKQDDTNTFRITFGTKRLKHNEHEHIGNLILVLRPNAVHPFQVQFRITAANITKVIQGAIPIVVNAQTKE
jgi:PIN domain